MKKQLFTLYCLCAGLLAFSHCQPMLAQHHLVVTMHDGQTFAAQVDEIDSLSFSADEPQQEAVNLSRPSAYQSRQDKWHHNLENQGIADYLRDFDYPGDDYSFHHLFDYRGYPYLDSRQDQPYGVSLYWPKEMAGLRQQLLVSQYRDMREAMTFEVQSRDSCAIIYNLIPSRTYYYIIKVDGEEKRSSHFETLGQLRMLRADSLNNLRDLGGWPTVDGHTLRHGRIIRGVELSTLSSHPRAQWHRMTRQDSIMLRDVVGIKAELDLRAISEIPGRGEWNSPLGADIAYLNVPNISSTSIVTSIPTIGQAFTFIVQQLDRQLPVYLHCVWGADRTGLLCMLLEGALGVDESSLNKDYELTSFCGDTRFRNDDRLVNALTYIKSLPGETLQEKFAKYWLMAGVSRTEIDHFRELMLE